MLPLEMASAPGPRQNATSSESDFCTQDFAHEAWNSDKVREDFAHLKGKTALYVPEVLWAERRCLVMECESPRASVQGHG